MQKLMAGKTGDIESVLSNFEKRFETALGKSDFVSEGILVALDFEKESEEFYSNAAKRTTDAGAKSLFEFLATEEARHFAALEELKKSLQSRGKWIAPPNAPRIKSPDIFKLKTADPEALNAGEHTEVLSALHAEKEAQYYYARLADKTEDQEGKRFFFKMAEFEKAHAQLLDGLFEQMLFVKDMQLG